MKIVHITHHTPMVAEQVKRNHLKIGRLNLTKLGIKVYKIEV